jgi:hypothetical protein
MLGALVRANRLLLQDIRLRVRRIELERAAALREAPTSVRAMSTKTAVDAKP